ncbi:Hsp20/alpha crystallin family protein [Prosthecochloris sp. N3]|uniref:Hsp20/alpha crystallin family protein n=1 Tax=Prosthecochloris ethylica TaxID=2743976 RepID=A0ABR9XS32_9CHLB|nr:Hsp20/alpha crystallin family protein [Prosthecochloris ethylica]MBF0586801.1 Hsp20/alpha crystallin family protein [Prosthecochloris ethylica]MBF0636707.1 Hsp20/alpha crystallin family protein [Prosthecochloris ethylica]NUK47894.1 Hsp20/alpha crystallin family protein [Prosthecochloris ethylica]
MLVKLSKDPLKLFDDIWEQSQLPSAPAFKVDITEDSEAFYIEAELPGLKKENITLGVEDDVLIIKAENQKEQEEHEKNYHRIERSYGSYSRSFNLGEMINQDQIGASYDNGILTVTLPKAQEVKKSKEIAIS